ncbi:MAG: DNA primase [Armatimonadota bacterium]|nr:DNA primase [Armatimonadota bacterium]
MADRSDIDEVRTRTDLVSVVERYVTLKRAGRQLKGLCPFHQEKTPSFVVSPEIGYWKCFGQCGEGGDVFKFVQKIENLSFPEALERLALQAGVTLTRRQPHADAGTDNAAPSEAGLKDRLRFINGLALRFYRDVLARSPVARDYLQERGLAHAAQENFQLGFAADEWDGLCRFLTRSNVDLADAEKAGLVTIGERGPFDKLRGRLVFPILDVHERPIAFGGRLVGEARPGQPKYWNSPETPLFSKGREMYGLWRARKAIAAREQAVVVEGYTDVIACHQAGFENVVATLGTSLTEEHVQTLARLASVVLLAFDADSAGLKAAGRAAQIFEAQEVDVRVLDMPEGEDPDSLLKAGKRRVFEEAMENALPLTEYRIKRLIRKGPAETERDRVALFRKALPILASVPSILEREQYVKLLAPYHPHYGTGAAFAEEHIRQDVAGHMAGQGGAQAATPYAPRRFAPATPLPPTGGGATAKAEQHLLRALVSEDPALTGLALSEMTAAEFVTEGAQALAAYLYDHYAQTGTLEPKAVLAALGDDPRADRLAELVMNSGEEPLTSESLAGEIAYLKDHAKEQTLSNLKARIMSGTADAETQLQFRRLLSELKGTPKSLPVREGK